MNTVIRYFTGTGNTERGCKIIAETLALAGQEVDMREFTDGRPEEIAALKPDLLILAFSVLGFSPAQAFYRWVSALPCGNGCPVVIAAVCGSLFVKGQVVPGFSGDATGILARKLKAKGFSVIGSAELSYPDNWTQVTNPANAEDTQILLAAGDAQAQALAQNIRVGKTSMLVRPISRIIASPVALLFRSIARRFFGLLYISDTTCTGCGLCAQSCPSSAIHLKRQLRRGTGAFIPKSRPEWNLECQGCNRCINICPSRSIQTSPARFILHAGLNIAALAAGIVYAGIPSHLLGITGFPGTALSIFSAAAFFILFSLFQLTFLEMLLRAAGRTETGMRVLSMGSWTKNFRRHTAPGYKAPRYDR